MSNQGVGSAFIDLATYGEVEKRLYSIGPSTGSVISNSGWFRYAPHDNRVKNKKMLLIIMLIIFLIYIKG